VAEGWGAKFVNFTLLHEPYHGVHHWRPGMPHPELPAHAAALEPNVAAERPPFRTFGAAVYDLFINLGDPRVGAQWLGETRTTHQEQSRAESRTSKASPALDPRLSTLDSLK
jgi:fatty acid desaturase